MESLDEVRKSLETGSKQDDEITKVENTDGNSQPNLVTPLPGQPIAMDHADSSNQLDNNDTIVSVNEPPAQQLDVNDTYPSISSKTPAPESIQDDRMDRDEEDEFAQSFQRTSSPPSAIQRNRGAVYEKVGEGDISRMHKFSLYETAGWFYIVGGDLLDRKYRILKIDRTVEPGELNIVEDDIVYTKKEMNQILNAVDEGNKSSGGLKLKCSTWGLLGFIRFTGAYYALFITKRSQVAMIGGHYVYQVDGTDLVQVTQSRTKAEKNTEEARFLGILQNLDLTKSFYFSYSYDITRTLQFNIMRERKAIEEGLQFPLKPEHNDMFVWNHFLLKPAKARIRNVFDWCLPIIHGYVDQSSLSVYWGRVVYITVIARRSRFFAGARFLKRGANDLGYVANDVESEQIVANMATTSFHAPGPKLYANSNYTSYVQHRGSIPLYWTQDATGMTPKPDIEMNLVDPFYSAAALHFDNLFERYGAPIYVLNLIKARERTPRESKLLKEFTTCIAYLNQFLPLDRKILYKAWDMSRASKSRDQDVIGTLEDIGEEIIPITGFFQNGTDAESGLKLQNGVARTNCIDCLDRTNAAQFVIGKRALGHQLHALGIIDHPSVEYDSDAVDLFTHMFHDHGDTIAVQYGGSHLVNTMATYRKINAWTSNSRDMVESFKRYYNNSFLDAQRQEAYNLFLGNYVFAQGQPMLWDLVTDYYLHHTDPRAWLDKQRPAYINWFTPEHLQKSEPLQSDSSIIPPSHELNRFDDYWLEYYRPLAVSSFQKMFSYKMHSNLRYIPFKNVADGKYDLSPFKPRVAHEPRGMDGQGHTKPARRKGVKILEPTEKDSQSDTMLQETSTETHTPKLKPSALGPWVESQTHSPHLGVTSIMKEPSFELSSAMSLMQITNNPTPASKAQLQLEAFAKLVQKSLNPTVDDEIDEYERYVSHPHTLPLVVRTDQETNMLAQHGEYDPDISPDVLEFVEYVNKAPAPLESYPTDLRSPIPIKSSTIPTDSNMTSAVMQATRSPMTPSNYNHHTPLQNSYHLTSMQNRNTATLFNDESTIDPSAVDGYLGFLKIPQEGLSVLEEDYDLKRYKRYRSWLRGKSLFKVRE
ncbi:putative polyphosphoinositide phosphatase fig4 [Phaeomoniella chlamydospora]|uniref:Putative polyphosphoinositide phosphatase fig4 n=1 Tax=Phaeomoniella chlamydospora TaxID=158046 RepID=A0A0G2F0E8_PHACM|nr:putative polyphosphoinositide phosphatase fig4 [Phaeomoniella chlamydospora]